MPDINQYLKLFFDRFLKLRDRPRELALGFSLGIFIGLTPSMGIQIAVAVFIASLLKWSKIAAALGVQIPNPLTAPFIYSGTYFIGAKIIGLEKSLKLSSLMTIEGVSTLIKGAPEIFAALTIGAVFIGVPLAVASYFLVYWFISRYQEKIKIGIQKKAKNFKHRLQQRKTRQKKR